MPLYTWACKNCKMQVELLRSFDDCRVPPNDIELGDAATCVKTVAGDFGHRFEKVIHPPNVAFGESWGGRGKGSWGSR